MKTRINPKLKEYSRENRKHSTYAEKVVWNMLRDNRLGEKFRRQHVIEPFIVDFYCNAKKLIIEIDGETHVGNEDYDLKREEILTNMGYHVIRFSNELVLGAGEKVENEIKKALQ